MRYSGVSTILAAQISPTNIFAPASTPAHSIHELYLFVLAVTGAIFLVVFGMLIYAAVKYRSRPGDDREPVQIYGSDQLELAWTVIPVLIVMVLFLSSARVIHALQDAPKPPVRATSSAPTVSCRRSTGRAGSTRHASPISRPAISSRR